MEGEALVDNELEESGGVGGGVNCNFKSTRPGGIHARSKVLTTFT